MKDEHSTMPKPISTPNEMPTILVLPLLLELLFRGVTLIAEIKGPCVWIDGMQQVPLLAEKKVYLENVFSNIYRIILNNWAI